MITSYKPLKNAKTKLKEKKAANMNDSKNEEEQRNWQRHKTISKSRRDSFSLCVEESEIKAWHLNYHIFKKVGGISPCPPRGYTTGLCGVWILAEATWKTYPCGMSSPFLPRLNFFSCFLGFCCPIYCCFSFSSSKSSSKKFTTSWQLLPCRKIQLLGGGLSVIPYRTYPTSPRYIRPWL